jgi:hypothetical protein
VSNQEVLTLTGCQATFDEKNIGKLKKYRNLFSNIGEIKEKYII